MKGSVEREVTNNEIPASCPRCKSTKFWTYIKGSQVVYDLKFMRKGVKAMGCAASTTTKRRCSRMSLGDYPIHSCFAIRLKPALC